MEKTDIKLDIYKGQILALLGHNGAGKTTMLQLLGGMLSPSSGDAVILGLSLKEDMKKIRSNLGFCPQHDVLYDDLTVSEHLSFYGSIKGLSGPDLTDSIVSSILQVGLVDKTNVAVKALSGGMKRKLSLAIALVGDAKVIFVDEPTSGVDTWSRRSMWEVLQNNREGRVIVLTTHFMDEADLLGDRIAIMAEGELKCCGSSLFLKDQFGAGYLLTMVKGANANVSTIKKLISESVSNATLQSNVGTEIAFKLPTSALPKFAKLFRSLDSSPDVAQYGISVTTLEEVFLQVARADDQKADEGDFKQLDILTPHVEREPAESLLEIDDVGPVREFALQFSALFVKRFHYSKRDRRAFCCSILLPVLLFAVGLITLKFQPIGEDLAAYTLSTGDMNPYLGVMEFDVNEVETTRITSQDNFIDNELLRTSINTSKYQGLRTIFSHEYQDGFATEEECNASGGCVNPTTTVEGISVLQLCENLIYEPPSLNGSSLYASVTIIPKPASLPYSCLIASFETSETSISPVYASVPCSEEGSACMMLESEVQGTKVCLPAGCFSDIDSYIDDIVSTIQRGSNADEDELINQALLLTCEGELCNRGPSNLFESSVCRTSDSCIKNSFTAYRLNASDGLSIYSAEESLYCTRRELGENMCQVSGLPGTITDIVSEFVIDQFTSIIDANFTCTDPSVNCSYLAFEGNVSTTCLVDSCAQLNSTQLEAFGLNVSSGLRYNCDTANTTCDTLVDLGFLNVLTSLNFNTSDLASNSSFGDDAIAAFDNLVSSLGNITNDLTDVFVVAFQTQNFTALENITNGVLTSDFINELIVNVTSDIDVTQFILDNPALLQLIFESLLNVTNTPVNCESSCLLTQLSIPGGLYCVPLGCESDFQLNGFLSLLPEGTYFTCDGDKCNDKCSALSNCKDPAFQPKSFNGSALIVDDSLCPSLPLRFSYIALINSTASHGAPVIANSVHTALLRTKLGEQFPDYVTPILPRITTNSHPLPYTASLETIIDGFVAFTVAIFCLIAFAFIPSSVAGYVVQEREASHNIKHQQFVSGVGVIPYWLSLYAFDMVAYLIPFGVSILLILAFDVRAFLDNDTLGAVVLLLFGYGCAIIPFAYLLSNMFQVHTSAQNMVLMISLLTGLILMIASFVMDIIDNQNTNELNADLKALYRVFPGYCLGDGLRNLAISSVLSGFVGPSFVLPSPYEWDIAGADITYLFIESILFFSIVVAIDAIKAYNLHLSPRSSASQVDELEIDEDVLAEEERVHQDDGDMIRVLDMRKVYKKGKVAVNGVSFGKLVMDSFREKKFIFKT